jgi:3-oxoacyl-[acyl-carrier-protein] synthase-1
MGGADTARTGAWQGDGALEILVSHSLAAWRECLDGLSDSRRREVLGSRRLGVIFASTKGCVDDWVWQTEPDLGRDPLTPVLEAFISAAELSPSDSICVSNACASSVGALLLAREWLAQERVDHVVLIAADHPARFVRKGFETLKVLSPTSCRPFSGDRDGLVLGDAAAAILLSRDHGEIEIQGVATDTEGYAVTRPEHSGASLRRACVAAGAETLRPDLIVAHATGTKINDATEDHVFCSLYGAASVPVTATKWSIGHTLGASAAMDVIAACEILRRQEVFRVAPTTALDPALRSRFLAAGSELPHGPLSRVLVTSLGFGGVHSAALIAKADSR